MDKTHRIPANSSRIHPYLLVSSMTIVILVSLLFAGGQAPTHANAAETGKGNAFGALVSAVTRTPYSPGGADDLSNETVQRAENILVNHADFEINLRSYQSFASQINQYLGSIEKTRSALTLVDRLKQTSILGSNAWDMLIDGLDAASAGSGQMLAALDGILRNLLRIKDKLAVLNGLSSIIQAASDFRSSPSSQTLTRLVSSIRSRGAALADLDSELADQIQVMDDLQGNLSTLQDALSELSALSKIPQIGPVIARFNQVLSELTGPVRKLNDICTNLHRQMQDDIGVMASLQNLAPHVPGDDSSSDSSSGDSSDSYGVVSNICKGIPSRIAVGMRASARRNPTRLRSGAFQTNPIIRQLAPGTEFTVIGGPKCGTQSPWWEVQLDDRTIGWIEEGWPGSGYVDYYMEPVY